MDERVMDLVAIREYLSESSSALLKSLESSELEGKLVSASQTCVESIKSGGKIMFCGNGGSAADSQHLAAELVSRFEKERNPISAVSLTVDTSIITAISNDYSFQNIFSRQVEAIGKSGDVIFCISTSGNSRNVINAAISARELGINVISLTGHHGGGLAEIADIPIMATSSRTGIIQQLHITYGHILCSLMEQIY